MSEEIRVVVQENKRQTCLLQLIEIIENHIIYHALYGEEMCSWRADLKLVIM